VSDAISVARELAAKIDHTLLRADAAEEEIRRLCDEAVRYGFASVCVNSRWVPMARELLKAEQPLVCSVVAFPLGAMAAPLKAKEAAWAVEAGARELDMVIDLASLKAGAERAVQDDIAGVVEAAPHAKIKVILETGLLDDATIARACILAQAAGAHFVKTSTGFGPRGATTEDVRLMRAMVGAAMGVKASGGIRDRATALAMLDAGADRLGSSSGIRIVAGVD